MNDIDKMLIKNFPDIPPNEELKERAKKFYKAIDIDVQFNGDDAIVFAQNQTIDKRILKSGCPHG